MVPEAAQAMQRAIREKLHGQEHHEGWLAAYLGVRRVAKAQNNAGLEEVDPLVGIGLGHAAEDLRLDAMACICTVPKKASRSVVSGK